MPSKKPIIQAVMEEETYKKFKLKWERVTILTIKFRPAWLQPGKTDIVRQ